MKSLFAPVAVLLSLSSASLSADLPRRSLPPAAPPSFTWTGAYLGVHAGYGWSSDRAGLVNATSPFFTDLVTGAPYLPRQLDGDREGFVGGGQVGYNVQLSRVFVVGVEADISAVDGRSDPTRTTYFNGAANVPYTITTGTKVDWLATVRGRLGFLATPDLLIYSTGGIAFGGVHHRPSYIEACCGPIVGDSSETEVGYAIGTGAEYAYTPHLSFKIEYMFYDLGSRDIRADSIDPAFPGEFFTYKTDTLGHIGRAGVNYKF